MNRSRRAGPLPDQGVLPSPLRILFIFDWLVVGGEETELRLLASHLDRRRYQLAVAACFRNERMTGITVSRLQALGVPLDTACYELDDDERRRYLAGLIRRERYTIVVACQGVQHAYRAIELLPPDEQPALIEHGGLVSEVARTPKHLTSAYVGVSRDIVAAAAATLPDPERAHLLPSMVDLAEFDSLDRATVRLDVRREFGFAPEHQVAGWVGRLDRKKRVEDFIESAALLRAHLPSTRFLLAGGADAFMPDYEAQLKDLARTRGLDGYLVFTGDRADVPRLLYAMDAYAWLSQGEGMPHVVLEAGAARLPVVATPDGGVPDVITHGETGLFVPPASPAVVAEALERLFTYPDLAARLGTGLRRTVERTYSTDVVCPQWEALFHRLSPGGYHHDS